MIVKYGANVPSEQEKLGRTKTLFLSYQDKLVGPIIEQCEAGLWFDNSGIEGRRSSGLLGYSLGVHANAGAFFAQALVGPSLISSPDSNLGGAFQFNNDIGFGIRDEKTGGSIGLAYKHVSSAGIYSPNKGRDFIMFRVGVPF